MSSLNFGYNQATHRFQSQDRKYKLQCQAYGGVAVERLISHQFTSANKPCKTVTVKKTVSAGCNEHASV